MAPEIDTAAVPAPSIEEEVEATLRDVRSFMDDPVALLEPAADLLRRRAGGRA